jgi:hypothetical protein
MVQGSFTEARVSGLAWDVPQRLLQVHTITVNALSLSSFLSYNSLCDNAYSLQSFPLQPILESDDK